MFDVCYIDIARDVEAAAAAAPRMSAAARAAAGEGLVAPAAGTGPGGMVLSGDLVARRWSGLNWEPLGSRMQRGPAGTAFRDHGLVVDSTGVPVAVWSERVGASDKLQVARFVGGLWSSMNPAAGLEGSSSRTARIVVQA